VDPEETIEDRIRKLIQIGAPKEAVRDQPSIDQYLNDASDLLTDAKLSQTPLGGFLLAYEGLRYVAMAFLAHHGARPGDEGHRQVALQVAYGGLGMPSSVISSVMKTPSLRNGKIYRQPIPPMAASAASAVIKLLDGVLPKARELATWNPP
jgi:hypothetical protein